MAISLSHSIALLLPAELEILEILWYSQPLTAKELHGVLVVQRSVSYRSVKTILNIMQAKGFVEKQVLRHPVTYQAVYSRHELQEFALTHLAQSLFQGNMSTLLRVVVGHPNLEDSYKNLANHRSTAQTKQVN
jgi:predicted transcriptional regulator